MFSLRFSPRRIIRIAPIGVAVLLLLIGSSSVRAQAAPDESVPDFRFDVVSAAEGGAYTYVPEKWGQLRVRLVNGRPDSRELLCSTSFDQDSSLQYGRKVWLPARSVLRISHPILMPKCDPKSLHIGLHSIVVDDAPSGELLVKSEGGQLRIESALTVVHEGGNTAIIEKPPRADEEKRSAAADLVIACRVGLQRSNRLIDMQDSFLPPDETSLEGLEYIVVADNRVMNDYAAATALRRWLHAGGHLWIMLDQVDPRLLELLVGDEFTGYVVDRVGLTTVRIDQAPSLADPTITPGKTAEYEDPVDLVRMVVSDVNVKCVVNGWPAAVTKACGDGKLLITTLGARGWMAPQPEGTVRPNDPLRVADYVPVDMMTGVADEFFRLHQPDLLPPAAIEPQVGEYIGYSIPSWELIVGTLLTFSAGIVLIGVWLLRIGQLEQICWVGSILAVVVSMFLIQAGRMNRQVIPATMASVQFVRGIRGTDDSLSNGLLSVYHPDGSASPIAATRGGSLVPDMTGLEQTSRRMVTTDLGAFQWENLRQPAGIRSTSFEHSAQVSERMTANVTFNSEGLTGQYAGAISPGADALVAARDGRIGCTINADGTFVARGEDVFEKDQFLGAGLLSDEQDRRRRTLRELLDNPARPDYPGRPQLMFWSEPQDDGFSFGENLRDLGASLIAVPLSINRPASGTEIMIPAPFLSYVNRRSPDGSQPSTMWNAEKKLWQERSSPGLAWLSFQIPRELLPVTAQRARLDLKVSGPIGRVEIFGQKNGSASSLGSVVNPVGSISFEIADPELMEIDGEGRLALGLSAGQPANAVPASGGAEGAPAETAQPPIPSNTQGTKANYWRIESLALQLWAKTVEPTAKD
jgi:hypothetical protein